MKKIIFTVLLLSVFLAGCTNPFGGGTSTGTASGVVVRSFGPDISEIYPGDDVVFTMSVENAGGEDATGVTAKLFGLGSDWEIDQVGYQSPKDLTRAQPDAGITGGSDEFVWTATAPSGLKREQSYEASARLKYNYKTTAVGTLKVYNSDYLRTRPEEAKAVTGSSGLASSTVTDAPLRISFAGVARPIIYRGGGQTYAISAQIQNSGQGYPFGTDENDMMISVDSMTVDGSSCNPSVVGSVRLPRGGTKSISCSFNVPSVSEYTTIPVEIVISYNYFVDSKASINVLAEVV